MIHVKFKYCFFSHVYDNQIQSCISRNFHGMNYEYGNNVIELQSCNGYSIAMKTMRDSILIPKRSRGTLHVRYVRKDLHHFRQLHCQALERDTVPLATAVSLALSSYALYINFYFMSQKALRRLQVFFASAISKRFWSRASGPSYCATKLEKMDAIKTMKDLGYGFNADGQLRKIGADGQTTEEPFQFNVSKQHQECQAHYEELGNAVTEYIYYLLESDLNLTRLPVPKDSNKGTFIFASKDYDKKDVLVILIHGSGAVRAGQWARSLIINDNLDMGTQIPYIRNALSRDYGVLVLNPNDNCLPNGQKIPHSGSGEEHTKYVWNTYIQDAKAASIAIVAHSYGGVLTVTLADQLKQEFEQRVKAIAFTDSVHVYSNIKITKYLKEVAINWISSQKPLDTPMTTPDFDIPRVSAGHEKHEMTSYSCMESVFELIEKNVSKNEQ